MASSFSESSLQICRDFLQTAVIIDDRFNFQSQPIPRALTTAPGRGYHPRTRPEVTKTDLKEGALNANRLIKSFAVHGIICGILDLKEYKEDSITFLKTAKRADIAIIDWEMEEEKTGEHALNLISELLNDDLLSPQRFRLISIYTGAEDLSNISETIQNYIHEMHAVQFDVHDLGLLLRYQSITITIFAKEGARIPDYFKKTAVNENELPDRLIFCFFQSVKGILPNTALAALTALRQNSHKLLGQFSNRLDAAYLSHKIMSNPPDEAENQLVQLIGSHILGILEENNVADQANYAATESWVIEQCDIGTQFRTKIHIKKDNEHAKEQLLKLLKCGLAKASLNKGNKTFYKQIGKLKHEKTKSVLSGLTAIFAENPEDAEKLDRELSYLLACKASYTSSNPKLEPGTILKHLEEPNIENYFICIQPACDCVRIPKKGRKFLFLPLIPSQDKFDICIPKEQIASLNLKVDDKAYSIKLIHFTPPKASEPIHANRTGTQWMFLSDEPSISYEWIATLKSELVLRLAHNYGKNVSRVGITESEWQRRWAK